jgi:hypothetical protein
MERPVKPMTEPKKLTGK